jgi:hypothetical protein
MRGYMHGPAQFLLDPQAQRVAGCGVTVHHEGLAGRLSKAAQPGQEFFAVGVP